MCDTPLSATNWHFEKLIAFGYHDGPTEGILECSGCVYTFKMIALDTDRDMRIVKLSEIDREEFTRIIAALAPELGLPRWPVWVPRWEFSSDVARENAEAAVNEAYRAGRTVAVALCDDTLEKCSAVRAVEESDATRVVDWFAFVQAECD